MVNNFLALVPVLEHLKSLNKASSSCKTKSEALVALRHLFKALQVRNTKNYGLPTVLHWEIYLEALKCLPSPDHILTAGEERLASSAVLLLRVLFESIKHPSSAEVFQQKYCNKDVGLNAVAYNITVFLDLAKQRSKDLAWDSLSSLSSLLRLLAEQPRILANFLPGICCDCCSILTGDFKHGQNVFVEAVTVWEVTILSVLSDRANHNLLQQLYPHDSTCSELSTLRQKLQEICSQGSSVSVGGTDSYFEPAESNPNTLGKDQSWLLDTTKRMHCLLQRLFLTFAQQQNSSSSWKLRLRLAQFASNLLKHCNKCLSSSVPLLLEALVFYTLDPYQRVRSFAKTSFQELGNNAVAAVHTISQDSLQKLLFKLPRIIVQSDDEQILWHIRLLSAYLKLFRDSFAPILSANINSLSVVLFHLLEFDTCVQLDVPEKPGVYAFAYQFKHFREAQILLEITRVCRLLGAHGNLELIVDFFLSYVSRRHNVAAVPFSEQTFSSKSYLHEKSSIWILNQIVLGAISQPRRSKELDSTQLQEVILSIVSEYIDSNPLHQSDVEVHSSSFPAPFKQKQKRILNTVPPEGLQYRHPLYGILKDNSLGLIKDGNFNDIRPVGTYNALNDQILQTVLIVEGIAYFARAFDSNTIELYLMKVIQPLLEILGNERADPRHKVALWCLAEIRIHCAYSSILDLVNSNIDYVIDSVVLSLKYLDLYPHTLRVINGLLQFASTEVFLMLEDAIREVLNVIDTNILRKSHSTLLPELFDVLRSAVECIEKDTFDRDNADGMSTSGAFTDTWSNSKADMAEVVCICGFPFTS